MARYYKITMKELTAELTLQLLDSARQRRLSDVAFLVRKVQMLRDREKVPDLSGYTLSPSTNRDGLLAPPRPALPTPPPSPE
jgi:hypothetical protein